MWGVVVVFASRWQPLSKPQFFSLPASFSFCRELGAIVATPYERDVFRCAMRLVEGGFSSKEALEMALGPWGKRFIRTSTPLDIDARIASWLDKHSKLNRELVASDKRPLFRYVRVWVLFQTCSHGVVCRYIDILSHASTGIFLRQLHPLDFVFFPSRLLSPMILHCLYCFFAVALGSTRRGPQPSTEEAVANVRKCVQKGCLFSGLDLKDQYSVDSIGAETGLRAVHKLIGTGKNECFHR